MKRTIVYIIISILIISNINLTNIYSAEQTVTSSAYYEKNTPVKIVVSKPVTVYQDVYTAYKKNIVTVRKDYTYDVMAREIEKLRRGYPQLEVSSIGKSVEGRNIYCLKIGNGKNKVMYTGATHARENITTVLLMKYAEILLKKSNKLKVKGMSSELWKNYNANNILKNTTLYIIPMVNPDGVNIVYNGLKKTNPNYYKLMKANKYKNLHGIWKANARGVDINLNYNKGFNKIKYYAPGYADSKGPYPESEPETKAVANFLRKIQPSVVFNYHAMGSLIYSSGLCYKGTKTFGKILSKASGYPLQCPQGTCGGCTDYINSYWGGKILAYTIEVGYGNVPVNISQFNSIWNRNYHMLTLGLIYKTSMYKK